MAAALRGEGFLSSPLQDVIDRINSAFEMEWNFQNHDSLEKFSIGGKCEVVGSFPPPGLQLPAGLIELQIYDFPNLAYLDRNGFQHLTSLEKLKIWSCPMLETMPEGGLSTSVHYLEIRNCPLLKERLEMGQGKEWDKIAHVEVIMIDDEWIQ